MRRQFTCLGEFYGRTGDLITRYDGLFQSRTPGASALLRIRILGRTDYTTATLEVRMKGSDRWVDLFALDASQIREEVGNAFNRGSVEAMEWWGETIITAFLGVWLGKR